jgi:hypothetical protein
MIGSPILFTLTLALPHQGEGKNSASHELRYLRITKPKINALMRPSPETVLYH